MLLLTLLAALPAAAQTVIIQDAMTDFPTGWVRARTSGDYWARMSTRYTSPSYSAKCTNRAAYVANQNTWIARGFNLSGHATATLDFRTWVDCEPFYDYLVLELHTAGGWSEAWRRTGNYHTWDSTHLDISPATDSLRFRFRCDNQQQYEGVYVDDVVLTGWNPDVMPTAINAPTGVVDTADEVIPEVQLYNNSPMTVSYRVRLDIEGDWSDTAWVMDHEGFSSRTASFSAWNAAPRGVLVVSCSTMLAADVDPGNNQLEGPVSVRVHDLACYTIPAPGAELDSGYPVTPRAWVTNPGTEHLAATATMFLGDFYSDARNTGTIAPGESTLLAFATRLVTAGRGTWTARCTTVAGSDRNPRNDRAKRDFQVHVWDVSADEIVVPPAFVDSGELVFPQAVVRNRGTREAEFRCIFRIGSTWCDSQPVASLSPGEQQYVDFGPWQARAGVFALRCSTILETDLVIGNDTALGTVTGRYTDIGISRILSPHTRLMPGPVTPLVEVRNNGNLPAPGCTLRMSIAPAGYDERLTFTIAAGATDTIALPVWNAPSGEWTVTARAGLAGDMNRANDSTGREVTVGEVLHDVGASGFIVPAPVIDPGDVTPVGLVFNYGSMPEAGFPVVLNIEFGDAVFTDTQYVTAINPGEELEVPFRTWLAYTGDFDARSWTRMAGDNDRANDTTSLDVHVALHSVRPLAVLAPAGNVGAGVPLHPTLSIHNRGSVADSFPVFMSIETQGVEVYFDSVTCRPGAGETLEVALPKWVPTDTGPHQAEAWTLLPGDYHPDDDTIYDAFAVGEPYADAAALTIVTPSGSQAPGEIVPEVRVQNKGNITVSFHTMLVLLRAGSKVYAESAWVSELLPGRVRTLELPATALSPGGYTTCLTVTCQGDASPDNDTLRGSVVVSGSGTWTELSPMPAGALLRPVKRGGWLVAAGETGALYAAKGYKTGEFYRYRPSGDSWVALAEMPPGTEGKLAEKGCRGAHDGTGSIYMTKGNNTAGFWRYDVAGDSWTPLPDVPPGPSGKKVKGGTDLVFIASDDTGWVYLLKGYRTEFYRYNTIAGRWDQLRDAPAGIKAKWDKGSFLVHDGESSLYAHKAKYYDPALDCHEMWRYDLAADSWAATALAGMPRAGLHGGRIRRKKSKDGGSGAWLGDAMYALKGGNTQQFWSWLPYVPVWVELDTFPTFGTSGRKRRVKQGADLAALGGRLYALKGNKTLELWRYDLGTLVHRAPTRAGIQGEDATSTGMLSLWPNPARGRLNLACRLTAPGMALVYDAVGRRQLNRSLPAGSYTVSLDIRRLPAGVYFVRVDAGERTAIRKLIVQ